MLKNKSIKKLIALVLIITMTFAEPCFVTKAMAASIFDALYGGNAGNSSVEFTATFQDGNNSLISDVNNADIKIATSVNVVNNGYLKDAKVKLIEAREGEGLNFKVQPMDELPDNLQAAEDNEFAFKQINYEDEAATLEIPIEFKSEEYVNDSDLSKEFLVVLTGIFIDDEGDENKVEKQYSLNLSWKDERPVNIETSVEKYIEYKDGESNGVIVQTLVKVDSSTENKSLPVKSTEVKVNLPTVNGVLPSGVDVLAASTRGTNGKDAENVKFDSNNWYYDEANQQVTIKVENEKELVKVDEFADEFLKDAEAEVIEEERYYSKAGQDEFIITYTFANVGDVENAVVFNSTSEVTMKTFSGDSLSENEYVVTANEAKSFEFTEQTGDIVSYSTSTETPEISKVYTYANYNSDENYQVEYNTKNIVNVSYKDIVEEIVLSDVETAYKFKDGSKTVNNDTYYKEVSVDRDNLVDILGDQGKVDILDENGNVVGTMDANSITDEQNKITMSFNQKVSKLTYKISNPIREGNLVINTVKVSEDSSLTRDEYKNVESFVLTTNLQAKYKYVDNNVQIGTVDTEVKLNDTITKPNLVIDRDSLSTIVDNENVEFRIELNNDKETSDVYGASTFEIVLPEYVENAEVTNSSVAYGEGLDITNVEVTRNAEGRVVLVVTVGGTQGKLNSGVLTNGTNLEVYANISVNKFAPAKSDVVTLNYNNTLATANGSEKEEVNIFYSAPRGLVAVNGTRNYNEIGTELTSVNEGTQRDMIDIYTSAKVATMEVVVMNNNGNDVSNLSILGRIPFAGVKDLATGEDLGTTVDTRMVNGLVADGSNKGTFNVYYSENGEATKDLEDSNNGWTMNPESFENVKSYLIVPTDSEYRMADTEMLRFTYEYEIPENLGHNENIYGTFLAYYTNESELSTVDEVAVPDIIGLTTGEGPDVEISLEADKDKVNEEEEVVITSKVKNVGNEVARDVVVEVPLPQKTTLNRTNVTDEEVNVTKSSDKVVFTIPELQIGEEIELPSYIKIESMKASKGRTVEFNSTVTAKDLGTTVAADPVKVKTTAPELAVSAKPTNRGSIEDEAMPVGFQLDLAFIVQTLTSEEANNVVVKINIPDNVEYKEAYRAVSLANAVEEKHPEDVEYDSTTRTVTARLDKVQGAAVIKVIVITANMPEGTYTTDGVFTATAQADGTQVYNSNTMKLRVSKASITARQVAVTENQYVTEGDEIKYRFEVENAGSVVASSVFVKDLIPEGLNIKKIEYRYGENGSTASKTVYNNDAASVTLDIPPETTAYVYVTARANSLNGQLERSVTNVGEIKTQLDEPMRTNEIVHIVQKDPAKDTTITDADKTQVKASDSTSTTRDIVRTYKITGTAWLDSNGNGSRENDEEKVNGITARLVNSDTGVIVKTVTTDSNGDYTFAGIENGNYLVLFEYDTVKYTVTTYKKAGVEASINSDVITTKIEQDGKTKNGAVTDVIRLQDSAVANVDIGLALADTFDLQLDKTITKITVLNRAGDTTHTFDDVHLAQEAIAGKYLAGSTVTIEYRIKVTNVGDIAGYAKSVVDYIPQGMKFQSELNKDWYTGTDDNLYTNAFADRELKAGESAEVRLVLQKDMTAENTGIVNNRAEIFEDYNIYGVSDKNSTPANKAQGENDMGSADAILTVRTGEVLINFSVVITTMLLGGIAVFLIRTKIVSKKRKGGVQ